MCVYHVTQFWVISGVCEGYQLPYHDMVSSDPSVQEMCQVVAVEGQRPVIPNQWSDHPVMLVYFSATRCRAFAMEMWLSVCHELHCMSVTLMYCAQTTELIVMRP